MMNDAESAKTKILPLAEDVSFTYEEAIELTSVGRFHNFLLIISGVSLMAVVTETSCINVILNSANNDLLFTTHETSFVMCAGVVGVMFGNLPMGYLSDYYGRVFILRIILSVALVSSFLSIFSLNTAMLVVFRFITGVALSGCQSVFTLVSEYHGDYHRPKQLAILAAFLPIGLIYANAMATAGLYFYSWRAVLFVYLLPSPLSLLGLFAIPESPKFSFTNGKIEECMNTLRTMYNINTGNPRLLYPCELKAKENPQSTNKVDIRRLFQKSYLPQTLLLCSIAFIMSMAGGGVYMWTPALFNEIDNFQNQTVCRALMTEGLRSNTMENSSSFLMMSMSLSFLLFFAVTSAVIKKVGRKVILVFWFLVSIVGCGLLYFIANGTSVVVILFSLTIQSANLIGIVNGIAADYYPTGINAMAVSLVTIFSRLGVSVGSNIVGYLIRHSCEDLIFGFCGVTGLAVVCVILLQ